MEDFTEQPHPSQPVQPRPNEASTDTTTADPLLQVRHLKMHFALSRNWLGRPAGFVRAVDDVSFDLWPGRTVGLVGESGCGKTTLGRSLLRLVEPTAGAVLYQDRDLLSLPERELRRLRPQLQMVFQDPASSLNPRIPVGDAIAEPLRVHGIGRTAADRRERVLALLERVGLEPEHYDRLPRDFSGGQRQRIGIARALILQPRVLICDEAVSALDVSVQAQILNLLKDLQQAEGFAMLFISHDLGVIQFISDHILVMHHGRIIESGSPAKIYDQPREAYTRRLLAAVPAVPERGRE